MPDRTINAGYASQKNPKHTQLHSSRSSTRRRPEPVLRRVRHLDGGVLSRARRRRLAADGVHAVHFLDRAPLAVLARELQPGHIGARVGGVRAVGLLARRGAPIVQRGVEIEKRRRGVEEVVVARQEDVGGRCGVAGRGYGEFHGDAGHHGEELRVGRCKAGGVEEGGERADLHGDGL